MLEREVSIESTDFEGTMYDPTIARMEGLKERMTVRHAGDGVQAEVRVTEALMDALLDALDLAVNVGPGEAQEVTLEITYEYGYGRVGEAIHS